MSEAAPAISRIGFLPALQRVLLDVADNAPDSLIRHEAVSIEVEQKRATRGADLTALLRAIEHAKPLKLDRGLSGEAVLQLAWRACLDHLLCNERAALSGDAEGVHQMRVAVRRLRAILSAFGSLLPSDSRRWASNELRWFANILGEARNFDVFAASLLQPARAALPDASEFERLAMAAETRRRAAHARVVAAIFSQRYAAAVLAMLRWFEGCKWDKGNDIDDLRRPVADLAPILLYRCRDQVKKRSKHFTKQSEEKRHQLRIALKKLRYTAELLQDLYDPAEARHFVRRLKRLQDDLGDINDVRVGREIVASLAGPGAPNIGIGYAARRVLAWHERRLAENEAQLRQHLRQLLAAEPFWPRSKVAAA